MPENAPLVAGVRFGNAGKIEYFHTSGMRLESGEYVVVQSTRGPELGRVVVSPEQVLVNEIDEQGLRPILRLATDEDLAKADDLKQRARELLDEARGLAGEAGFPGHLDEASFTLDGRRLKIAYSHGSRVEHRGTARKLSDELAIRVDMSQIGARDRARMAGGYGICGRELCCANWLETFPAISIRMAKAQELPLNPQKISGLCGRLLCCLSYEEEGYKAMRQSLPKMGQRCSTPTGEGKVVALNILQRRVTLLVNGQRVEVEDRDLGLVVRWDPTSKAATPPPSLTPAEAVDQGLLTQEEADRRAAEDAAAASVFAPPSPLPPPRPKRQEARKEPQRPSKDGRQRRSRRRRRGARDGGKAPTRIEGAKTRTFRRGDAKGEPADQPRPRDRGSSAGVPEKAARPEQATGASGSSKGRRRRRRRRPRGGGEAGKQENRGGESRKEPEGS
ncbi:MAG: stage 0 sporulation family protein [Dehalococcoidia bacterium]